MAARGLLYGLAAVATKRSYDLDPLDADLPLIDVVQDLYSTDHAGYLAPTRQRELDHTDHTDPSVLPGR